MRRRFSSQPNSLDTRQRNSRRQKVRRLTFDSLEDRRLLAGLSIFVFDDANGSGEWESPSELPLAEQVVYVDQNNDSRLGVGEPYAIAGSDGKALLDNLANGIAILRLLGSASPATPVAITDSNASINVNLASKASLGNSAPSLVGSASLSVDEDSRLSLDRSILENASSDADDDSLWFFIVGRPTNGTLVWSVEAGGTYQPSDNFYGSDSIAVRAFDGKAWSSEMTFDIAVNSVDDLPTAIEFAGGSIPENVAGFVVGPITIVDIDGGPNTIAITPEDLYEISEGKLKLIDTKSLNYEESPSSELTIRVNVGDNEATAHWMTASLPVLDRDDPPTGMEFDGVVKVEEFIAGFEFGTIRVIDEDGGQYDFVVSDNRFEVVDGKLALKPGVSLIYADTQAISLTITAVSQNSSASVSEALEIEVVRAAPPWQNKNWALDVDNDNHLTPIDILIVINALNRMGTGALLDRLPPGSSTFVDVNGDRVLTPIDALILINALNLQAQGQGQGQGGGSSGGNGGSGGGSSGGVGEGEGSAPTAPSRVAGEFRQAAQDAGAVGGNDSGAVPYDDDNLSPFHTRKATRRVR